MFSSAVGGVAGVAGEGAAVGGTTAEDCTTAAGLLEPEDTTALELAVLATDDDGVDEELEDEDEADAEEHPELEEPMLGALEFFPLDLCNPLDLVLSFPPCKIPTN